MKNLSNFNLLIIIYYSRLANNSPLQEQST